VRISRVEATPLAIPLAQEFHWAGGVQLGANLVLFAVETDDGFVGYGESVCEAPGAVAEYGLLMARQVVGRSVGDVEAILRFAFLEGDDAETLAAHARRLADHDVFYVKVGRRRDDDAVVAAVREAIGPRKLLRIDPDEAWDAATAVERIRRLSIYDLDRVEQPVPHRDIAGLAHVRRKVDVKIAADQAVYAFLCSAWGLNVNTSAGSATAPTTRSSR
jgi:L-alanine-DL-glutamate epimerase-like enolase superfamily enzyme